MDPVSALLIAMFAAGYFTRNTVQDLAWKARGEDPPSYRREQDRIARRTARRPITERREARRFWVNAWEDAWESAEERRARAHAKRAERRHEKWRVEDVARAEDEAYEINRRLDPDADPDGDGESGQAGQCAWCPNPLAEGQAREVVLQGVPVTVCADCYRRHRQETAERQAAAQWPRCADCGRPTSAPQEDERDGRLVTVCRTCHRAAQHGPEPAPGPPPSPESTCQVCEGTVPQAVLRPVVTDPIAEPFLWARACPDCEARIRNREPAESPALMACEVCGARCEAWQIGPLWPNRQEDPHDWVNACAPCQRSHNARNATLGAHETGTDQTDREENQQPSNQPEASNEASKATEGATVIQFSEWRRDNHTGTNTEDTHMSGESTNLTAAIGFTQGMATQADQAVNEVEMSIAGLQTGGVTGPAVAALQQAMEALTQAAEAFRTASTELNSHMAVRDAYHANQGAGTREFVTQD